MSIWRVAAGIPASFADSIEDFVGLLNLDTWEGMYDLFHRDDVLKVLGKSVVDEYTARLERWEENYQKGGIEGAYAAGVEKGKFLTELASLLAPGGALAKIGAKVASVTGKATLETIGRVAGRGAHTADHVEDAAKAGDNLADLERKTDLPEHRDSTAGRETGQDSHTHDDTRHQQTNCLPVTMLVPLGRMKRVAILGLMGVLQRVQTILLIMLITISEVSVHLSAYPKCFSQVVIS